LSAKIFFLRANEAKKKTAGLKSSRVSHTCL